MNNELIEAVDDLLKDDHYNGNCTIRTEPWILQGLKDEIEQLRSINDFLRTHNEELDAECARLEKAREYVPMTDDEIFEDDHSYGRYWEKVMIKRAGLVVKEKE